MLDSYSVIGVDFGTDSVLSMIVDVHDGHEIASDVQYYSRWKSGHFCDPSKNQFRQHPLDYIEGLEQSIKGSIAKTPKNTARNIRGISVDTTGSTPIAVDKNGAPLSLSKDFEVNPDANHLLKGMIGDLTLASSAPMIFRALIEATAFGAKKIVDRFVAEGIPIKSIIALGGVAKKSSFVMQVVADVLDLNIRIARSDQACALGAAMFAAVASGLHPTIIAAQKAMGNGFEHEYKPGTENVDNYKRPFQRYSRLACLMENEAGSEACK